MINTIPSCTDNNETGLISFTQARTNIIESVPQIGGQQKVPIENARGRTLKQTIISPFNVPPHTNSAVDGYALNARSLPASGTTKRLDVTGIALAGQTFTGSCQLNQCVRIMTGAAIPNRCDTVIMQEHVTLEDDAIIIDDRHKPGQNVRQSGEDIRQGEAVLAAGKFLTPADIGLIASLGIAEINVSRKLRIALASTGDEIYTIGKNRPSGGIYDSNRYSLLAVLDRSDIEVINLGVLDDDPALLQESFNNAASHADIIISTGGVSVGTADYTKAALQTSGTINFWKVAIKPGRPLAFGKINDCVFFGLPGNPVAVLVTFYQFVLPALEAMLGITDKPIAPLFKARCKQDIRKKPGRTEIHRGNLEQGDNGEWLVNSSDKQGSGILSSMSRADTFIILDDADESVKAGELVTVQPFASLI